MVDSVDFAADAAAVDDPAVGVETLVLTAASCALATLCNLVASTQAKRRSFNTNLILAIDFWHYESEQVKRTWVNKWCSFNMDQIDASLADQLPRAI